MEASRHIGASLLRFSKAMPILFGARRLLNRFLDEVPDAANRHDSRFVYGVSCRVRAKSYPWSLCWLRSPQRTVPPFASV